MSKYAAPLLAILLIGASPKPEDLQSPDGIPGPPPVAGYLGDAAPDTTAILPPAPVAGTTRYQADGTMFLATRSMKDSPRWKLAEEDVFEWGIREELACAIGVELTNGNAPRTTMLLRRMRTDLHSSTTRPKDFYKRKRPFQVDEGEICEHADYLKTSPDYPSGHNTFGWGVGLVMAELVPDRATQILARARAFGESRMVCGVHNMSAVEAGRTNGSVVVAALHGVPQFRKDLEAAAKEIAAARKQGPAPDPAACAAEAELVAQSPYEGR